MSSNKKGVDFVSIRIEKDMHECLAALKLLNNSKNYDDVLWTLARKAYPNIDEILAEYQKMKAMQEAFMKRLGGDTPQE